MSGVISAAEVVQSLLPWLPIITSAAEGVGKGAAEAFSEGATAWARRGWELLRGGAARGGHEKVVALEQAAEDLLQHPEDADVAAALETRVRLLLTEDDELTARLADWMAEGKRGGYIADTSGIAIQGDVSGSIVVQGNSNVSWNHSNNQ